MIVLLIVLAAVGGFGMGYSLCAVVDYLMGGEFSRYIEAVWRRLCYGMCYQLGIVERWLDRTWERVLIALDAARAWVIAAWRKASVWLVVGLWDALGIFWRRRG